MPSENPANDEQMSAKNVIKTDSSKNSINGKAFSDSKSSLNDQHNLGSNLHRIRTENPSRIIFGHIIIYALRNKFDWYIKIKKKMKHNFMISESKIDNNLLISQFTMTGYSIPFRVGSDEPWELNTFIFQGRNFL